MIPQFWSRVMLKKFDNQDLRDRRFRRKNLAGQDFTGSNLRGCDFTGADLQGAIFTRSQFGISDRQQILRLALALGTTFMMGRALIYLGFSVLGQTLNHPAWPYIALLYGLLGLMAIGLAVRVWGQTSPQVRTWTLRIAGIAAAVLLGFFWLGYGTRQRPLASMLISLLTGWFALWLHQNTRRFYQPELTIIILCASTVGVYGLSLLVGTTALALLFGQKWLPGLGLVAIAVLLLQITLLGWQQIWQALRQDPGTCFAQANLTGAELDLEVGTPGADFTGAIGLANSHPTASHAKLSRHED